MSSGVPLYVAAPGMLSSEREPPAWRVVTTALAPFATQVVHRYMYLTEQEVQGLHAEQLALIDLLVLTKARAFVGYNSSGFSVLVREHRQLMALGKRSTTRLVPGRMTPIDDIMRRGAFF
jgi:hypothetical protein